MMLRIGGSVSVSDHKNANTVLIFFDDVITSNSFLEDTNPDNADFHVGCSAD